MGLRIFHLFANSNNLGDWGSAEGVKQLFRQVFKEIYFEDFFISYHDLNNKIIDRINNDFDLVVLGGGGLYLPSSEKLILRLSKRSLLRIKKPIVGYAMGLNFENHTQVAEFRYQKMIKEINRCLVFSSVRDQLTQQKLWDCGVRSSLVPCPSALLEPAASPFELAKNGRTNVGVILILPERLPVASRENYYQCMIDFINQKKANYNFYLISHSLVIEKIYAEFAKRADVPLLYPVNPAQLMKAYQQMDYIIGSRGHSAIFATGAGRPFINLSYNIKCDAFVKMISYPRLFSMKITDLSLQRLVRSFAALVDRQNEVKSLLQGVKKLFREQNINYLNKIKKKMENQL